MKKQKSIYYLSSKIIFLKKILDFVYSGVGILDKNELDQNIDNQIVIGSSGAIMDIPENVSTILDYNKSFNDNSLAISDSVNSIVDYNSIRIQTIGMEGFAPKMNCKFSFCLSYSES